MPEEPKQKPEQDEKLLPEPDDEGYESEAHPALIRVAEAVAVVLEDQKTIEAVKKWVEQQADSIPKRHVYNLHQLWAGYLFAGSVFAGIVVLAVQGIIKPEVVVSLLSLLLTAWYGRKNG
jgi:hypothetical protein